MSVVSVRDTLADESGGGSDLLACAGSARRRLRTIAILAALAAWALAAGCGGPGAGGMGPFRVEVALDANEAALHSRLAPAQSIELNLVGVSEGELGRWNQKSLNDYWQPEDALRTAAPKYVMTFGQDRPHRQELRRGEAIWKQWLGGDQARYLVVVAWLPWLSDDGPGETDPRRIVLPLDMGRYRWPMWGERTVRVRLGPGGIARVEPRMLW